MECDPGTRKIIKSPLGNKLNPRSENKCKNHSFPQTILSVLFPVLAIYSFHFLIFILLGIFWWDWLDFSVCLTQMDCKRKQYAVGPPVPSGLEGNDIKHSRGNAKLKDQVKCSYWGIWMQVYTWWPTVGKTITNSQSPISSAALRHMHKVIYCQCVWHYTSLLEASGDNQQQRRIMWGEERQFDLSPW